MGSADDTVLKAKAAFLYEDEKGAEVHVAKGATVRPWHPMVAGREEFFDVFDVDFECEPPKAHTARRAAAKPKGDA